MNVSILEPFLKPTDLRRNPYYSIYYINPATLLVTGIIPLGLLTYWNTIIYEKIKSSSQWHEQHSRRSTRRINGQRQENEFAKVLIGIVVIFILCNFLRVLLDFYEMVNIETIIACNLLGRMGTSSWVIQLNYFSKLMMATDASISMVIYCLINKNFRKKLFWWKRVESITTRQT